MQETPNIQELPPQLKPPGAGLPWYHLLILKYYIGPFVSMKTPRDVSRTRFYKITQKINAEIENLTPDQLLKKILVPPQKGLEDSSRYWSIAMTLEHIVIVGRAMCSIIPLLEQGQVPGFIADTAKVKPFGLISAEESVSVYKKFISEEYQKMDEQFKNFEASTRFYHPWFGMIQAKQWYWLISLHTGLHLKQIKEIKKKLI